MEANHIIKTLASLFAFAICGVSSLWAETIVSVPQPGTLSALLTTMDKNVKINGAINGSDIKYLRQQINNGNESEVGYSLKNQGGYNHAILHNLGSIVGYPLKNQGINTV